MITVPEAFITRNNVKKVLLNGQNCLIEKKVSAPSEDNARYVAQHALTYVTKGSLKINTDYATCTVNAGSIVFLPVGIYMLTDIIPADSSFEAYAFFFDEKLTKRFLGNVESPEIRKEPEPLIIKENDQIAEFLSSLLNIYGSQTEKNATNWKLLEFLNLIAKTPQADEFVSRLLRAENRKQYGIRALMERHFDKNLKIEDYAHLTGRSISTFHRDFKKQFGVAPKSWLLNKRLTKAKQYIEERASLKVSDLAYEIGYENTSHFIKAFQKHFGITPKQYQLSMKHELV